MKHKETVHFSTGLFGVGKVTVGNLLYQRLKSTKPNTVYLDGGEVRVAFGEDVGYINDDRLHWAGQIFWVYRLSSSQDIGVVCCSIVMFDTVHRWSWEYIPNYREIYIRVKKETLTQRNQKGFCTGGRNMVGMGLPFDEPQSPDLVLQDDGEHTPLELVEEIEGALYPDIVEHPIDNTGYRDLYYQNRFYPTSPSLFARYVSALMEPGRTLAELGHGNGQGALYFASLGLDVVVVDLSKVAIGMLRQQPVPHVRFVCGGFVNRTFHQPESYDYVHSRFTIHAINQEQERMLLGSMARALKPGRKFFIEMRSIHDSFYGKGEVLERNAFFYDSHCHRLLVLDELIEALRQVGFRIEYAREQTGFTPYGNNDPPVIHVVAVKN